MKKLIIENHTELPWMTVFLMCDDCINDESEWEFRTFYHDGATYGVSKFINGKSLRLVVHKYRHIHRTN